MSRTQLGSAGSQNKSERTYTWLRGRILDGIYEPGHRLVLDALAREMGVSPVPVREALRRLEAEGWVVYTRNIGAQVAPIDDERWEQEMRVLAVLEGNATALAAEHLRPADFRSLRDSNADIEQAVLDADLVKASRLNRAWHRKIYARCPNNYLVQVIGETQERMDAIRRTVFPRIPERGQKSVAEHSAILDLLEGSAPFETVERAARDHKVRTIEAFRASQSLTTKGTSR
ncbi:MAG: GntR family transcriptional regulator [Actinomycetota bacterium]